MGLPSGIKSVFSGLRYALLPKPVAYVKRQFEEESGKTVSKTALFSPVRAAGQPEKNYIASEPVGKAFGEKSEFDSAMERLDALLGKKGAGGGREKVVASPVEKAPENFGENHARFEESRELSYASRQLEGAKQKEAVPVRGYYLLDEVELKKKLAEKYSVASVPETEQTRGVAMQSLQKLDNLLSDLRQMGFFGKEFSEAEQMREVAQESLRQGDYRQAIGWARQATYLLLKK